VSWLGYVWLWKLTAQASFALLSGMGLGVYFLFTEVRRPLHFFQGLGASVGILLLSVPGTLVFETVKLTWANFALYQHQPNSRTSWPFVAALVRFTEPWHEWGFFRCHPRLRYVARRLLDADLERTRRVSLQAARLALLRKSKQQPVPRQRLRAAGEPLSPTTTAMDQQTFWAHKRADEAVRRHRKDLRGVYRIVADTDAAEARFSLWALRREISIANNPRGHKHRSSFFARRPRCWEALLFVWGVLGAIIGVSGQLVSLAYPFANAATQFGTHNLLQSTCFYATCGAMAIVVFLSPVALWQLYFAVVLQRRTVNVCDIDIVAQWIADYYAPPHAGCLQEAIPPSVLPAEVVAGMADFVTPNDVGLGSLTIAECNALKRQVAARHTFTIGAGDDDDDESDDAAADADDRAPHTTGLNYAPLD